jgi:hypothetical protein
MIISLNALRRLSDAIISHTIVAHRALIQKLSTRPFAGFLSTSLPLHTLLLRCVKINSFSPRDVPLNPIAS